MDVKGILAVLGEGMVPRAHLSMWDLHSGPLLYRDTHKFAAQDYLFYGNFTTYRQTHL